MHKRAGRGERARSKARDENSTEPSSQFPSFISKTNGIRIPTGNDDDIREAALKRLRMYRTYLQYGIKLMNICEIVLFLDLPGVLEKF